MSKKNKKPTNDVDKTVHKIVRKIKTSMTDAIIGEWINTPIKEFNNKSPLQMVKEGNGQEVLDIIDDAKKILAKERKENTNK